MPKPRKESLADAIELTSKRTQRASSRHTESHNAAIVVLGPFSELYFIHCCCEAPVSPNKLAPE